MAVSSLFLNIEFNGKTYKYPVAQVYAPNNVGPYGFSRDYFVYNDGFLHYKSYPIVSMFEFLEIPLVEQTYGGKFGGYDATFEVKKYKFVDTDVYPIEWYVTIQLGTNSSLRQSFYWQNKEIITPTISGRQGLGIAFNNHRNYKNFVTCSSASGFRPYNLITESGSVVQYKYDYTPYITNSFTNLKSWNRNDFDEGVLYKSSWYKVGGAVSLGYIVSEFTTSYFTQRLTYDVVIVSYPNQNPDNDNDDSGQSPPDSTLPGDGDTLSDPIPNPPALPIFDVTNTGFVVIYNPTVQEIRQLAYFMWSGEFVDLIKKMFASPFEAIISLKMLFCPITSGTSQTVWLGNVETDVAMAKVTSQFTDIDMGTLNVNEFFGSFADYSPFTKIQIYLPFIGFKDLNVDEVMNSQLHLRYRVDVYTGACIAYLTVTKTIKSTNLDSILYQFDGNCAMEIPFTSNDNSRYVAAIMNSVASSALSLANTSGFTLPTPAKGFNQKAEQGTFELGSLAPVANGMLDIMSAKPNVQRAGSLSGAVSAMAVKQPYLIIHRPIAQMPANYQHYIGIPLNLTRTLSNVKGFTVVSQVFLTSDIATDEEIVMITEILKNGVIF